MSHAFQSYAPGYNATGLHMYDVTPDDGADLPHGGARAVRINTGGTLTFTSLLGNTETVDVYDGEVITCALKRIFATGTTAMGIRAYV
ncbi:MAG: hypothetical protein AAGD34_23140 [Pseudomonadota bacterium]